MTKESCPLCRRRGVGVKLGEETKDQMLYDPVTKSRRFVGAKLLTNWICEACGFTWSIYTEKDQA